MGRKSLSFDELIAVTQNRLFISCFVKKSEVTKFLTRVIAQYHLVGGAGGPGNGLGSEEPVSRPKKTNATKEATTPAGATTRPSHHPLVRSFCNASCIFVGLPGPIRTG